MLTALGTPDPDLSNVEQQAADALAAAAAAKEVADQAAADADAATAMAQRQGRTIGTLSEFAQQYGSTAAAADEIHEQLADQQASDVAALNKRIDQIQLTPGKAGADGQAGADGKSAYQLARDLGYGGTLTQWLASLVGTAGKDGSAGSAGTDGRSAYQVARDAGYGGTIAQWLASLVGSPGAKGDPGSKGDPGASVTTRSKSVSLAAFALGATTRDVAIVWDTPFQDATYNVLQPVITTTGGVSLSALAATEKAGTKTAAGVTITVQTSGAAIVAGQVVTVFAIRGAQ